MTGQDFDKLFDQKTDKSYTAYFDNTKKERLYKMALIEAIEQKYLGGDKQKTYDELWSLIKTSEPFTTLTINEAEINDYLHLRALRTRFEKTIGTITVCTSASPAKITINAPQLRSGMKVNITGATGVTGLDGDFYIKKVGTTKFLLFLNSALDIPSITTGSYDSNSATLKVVYEREAKPIDPDRKYSPYSSASITNPRYEEAVGASGQRVFKIFPEDESVNLKGVFFDYISTPIVFIDPTDDVIDLEETYPIKFLYYIIDTAVKLFSIPTRDQMLYQLETKEIIDNQ